MTSNSPSPYRPPAEPAQKPSAHQPMTEKELLSAIGLMMSLISLFGPMIVCTLAMFRIIKVPWDSALVPLGTLMIGLPVSVIALILSIVARVKYRTWKSTIGIVAAILAIPVTLAATWLVAMIALANHPV
ncbi:hypothetical protein [Aporhodopirellula aestuarii]|uniref:Uncharacterized protein n=1 Tax=Aporhodopirellula aestuarii TaxID=2950107 RepID=A0ABT0U620_9BACT|nr:hypothetical protein [Aporhodopirellula aestuarii]MCM2372330.1 hypothetical protein [Aporhodopirellula aestuarii]